MEYLPEKKVKLQGEIKRKEEKLSKFREYIADNDVVLAFVKFLLAARQQNPWPEDPLEYLHDYFGNYKDPMWEKVEQWQEENKEMAQITIPELKHSVHRLEHELKQAK
jgi:hypothetical protein